PVSVCPVSICPVSVCPVSICPVSPCPSVPCPRVGVSPQVAELAVDSLCRGVFAGDSRALSVRSCFPALFQAERQRGSVLLGLALPHGGRGVSPAVALARRARTERWSQWSLRGGMESLAHALVAFVSPRGAELRCHAALTQLRRHRGRWQRWPGSLARVLSADLSPLAQELGAISAASVAVVNLQYRGVALPVTGFGHLVPSSEDPALLGIVYDSVAFPEHDGTPGGTPGTEGTPGTPSLRLTVMLGVSGEVLGSQVRFWGPQGMFWGLRCPHLSPLSPERIQRFLQAQALPLSLVGASYGGVSVNDCISSARAAVGRLLGSPPGPPNPTA
ncbi:protoporphyrinogen oxidase, partial [Parus major]|uniref:protoporphyrinogen oxidase n=1 Tax=Parus major TaxID=9157 RepID=UPI0007710D99